MFKTHIITTCLFLLVGFPSGEAFGSWDDYFAQFLGSDAVVGHLPERQALLQWAKDPDFQASAHGWDGYSQWQGSVCTGKLKPTSASQAGKRYHSVYEAEYPDWRVYRPNIPACRQHGQCYENAKLKAYLMSDLYQDSCGVVYRGYFAKIFLVHKETVQSLVSLGRSLRRDPDNYLTMYIPGGWSWVQQNRFMGFAPVK